MAYMYNEGKETSTIGNQLQDFYWQKRALIDLVKETYFGALADTFTMPKHYGKTIKRYHYLPLLDDRNKSDQGIDAAGQLLTATKWYAFEKGNFLVDDAVVLTNSAGFADEATARAAIADAVTNARATQEEADDMVVQLGTGNLYGSSKDVGTIAGRIPQVGETGGRVNRVGTRRIEIEGTMDKFGFFRDYTQDSLDFDSDAQLSEHIHREMLRGANEIQEDQLQIDLLNAVGTHRYAGAATSKATVSGETGNICEVTYADLSALSIELDDNRTPKETRIISGSRMQDTKTIPAARALLIGSAMIPTIERMTDHFGNQAFIPVQHYAAAGNILNGEIGTVGYFRIIVVPEMMHWEGVGAAVSSNAGYRETRSKYDVFPMLVVGAESFTTIGFQTGGKGSKFKIFHKKPGFGTADVYNDPYGEMGFMSIKWWYGFMTLRPERIACIYTVARV